MHQDPARASEIDAALRRVQRGVLITFAVCAVVISATAPSGPATVPAHGFPIAAVALAVGSVLARQASTAVPGRPGVYLALASLLLAACIGLVGVALAVQDGPRGTALAYALGGAILCLRRPVRLAAR